MTTSIVHDGLPSRALIYTLYHFITTRLTPGDKRNDYLHNGRNTELGKATRTGYSLVFETDGNVDSEAHHASPQNLSPPCTPISWEIADYSDCRKSSLESIGIVTCCFFTKSQKNRHHGEGDCERPLRVLAPLSPKEYRVAWAYFIASYGVSLNCSIRSKAKIILITDGYNTLTITSYLPYCSFASSCMSPK